MDSLSQNIASIFTELFSSHLALTFPYSFLASAMQSPCQSCDAPSRMLLYAGQYLQLNFSFEAIKWKKYSWVLMCDSSL